MKEYLNAVGKGIIEVLWELAHRVVNAPVLCFQYSEYYRDRWSLLCHVECTKATNRRTIQMLG